MRSFERQLSANSAELERQKREITEGSTGWESPSNIAIVKYWGKYPDQIPANASLSLTLTEACTRTVIKFRWNEKIDGPVITFRFDGEERKDFADRIGRYFSLLTTFMPWIRNAEFNIESLNTFPHSSGIASSASSMSALALGLCDIENKMYGKDPGENFYRKASFLSRLGSGSASRSVIPEMAIWGITASCKESSDEFAIPAPAIHEQFKGLNDSILIIESEQKKISSSFGHDLMKTNPYAKLRFEAAEENMQLLCKVMNTGDLGTFIDIMENEALSLHAMMMTSKPGYLLVKPNTIDAIQRIRDYRSNTGLAVGFTLDAGANVHVIYPSDQSEPIGNFIDSELKPLCEGGTIIHDRMGGGPIRLK